MLGNPKSKIPDPQKKKVNCFNNIANARKILPKFIVYLVLLLSVIICQTGIFEGYKPVDPFRLSWRAQDLSLSETE